MTTELPKDYEARITADIAMVILGFHINSLPLAGFYLIALALDVFKGVKAIDGSRECHRKECGKCQK